MKTIEISYQANSLTLETQPLYAIISAHMDKENGPKEVVKTVVKDLMVAERKE